MHADFVVWDSIKYLLEDLNALHRRLVLLDFINALEDKLMLYLSIPIPSQIYKFVDGDLDYLALVRSLLHCNIPEQLGSSDGESTLLVRVLGQFIDTFNFLLYELVRRDLCKSVY